MRIEITNTLSKVWGSFAELAELDELTSYPIDGAQFSEAFRNHVWDGREHLLRPSKKHGCHLVPTGVLADLDEFIDKAEVVDNRRGVGETAEITWSGPVLRPYQTLAIDDFLRDRGPFTGRGMLSLPIRSGKTKVAGGLISRLGVRTLFIVPSQLLLDQTVDNFERDLEGSDIGALGGGQHDIGWITVATAQSMLSGGKLARELLAKCDLLIVDEAHHLEGEAWRGMVLRSDAPYKCGLSATIFVSRERQNNKASIWLKACTGPILHRISLNRLIRQGYLKRPVVVFYRVEHPADRRQIDWSWVAKEQIAQNLKRNGLIAKITKNAVDRGHRVLLDTGRRDQTTLLQTLVMKQGVSCEQIHGGTPKETRWRHIERLQRGELQCIVGTVLGEGLDIPELDVVINAEGQKSTKAAMQRMRNLTPSEGKGDVFFVDFADLGSKILQKHSMERLNLYKGTRGFKVKVADFGDPRTDPLFPTER